MSSRRRLVSAQSRSASRRTQASDHVAEDQDALELPLYQQPSCPLTAEGRRKLRELASGRLNDMFHKHANESAKLLANSVWAINDRASLRRKESSNAAEREAKRRRANSTHEEGDNLDSGIRTDSKRAHARAAELEEQVVPLTTRVEAAMRAVIDAQAAAQDEQDAVQSLPEAVDMAQEAMREAFMQEWDGDDDGDETPPELPGVPVFGVLEKEYRNKVAAYEALSPYQRYAQNNVYVDFKRNWHDGLYDDEVPVPDARTWFDRDGNPQHMVVTDGDDDGSDADIRIAREKRSFRCPLSLVALTEPYTCRRCKHTFQKDAIYAYLGISQRNTRALTKPCPETGCQIAVSKWNPFRRQTRLRNRIVTVLTFYTGHEKG